MPYFVFDRVAGKDNPWKHFKTREASSDARHDSRWLKRTDGREVRTVHAETLTQALDRLNKLFK